MSLTSRYMNTNFTRTLTRLMNLTSFLLTYRQTHCVRTKKSEEEHNHEMENPHQNVIQLQPAAEVPPSLPEPEIPITILHQDPPTIPLSHQEEVPVATHHDNLPSPENEPPALPCDTAPFSPTLANVPSQQPSTSLHYNGEHEAPEQDCACTHATR